MTDTTSKPNFFTSAGGITLLAILGAFFLIILYGVTSFAGAYNDGNRAENALNAALDNNKNILSTYTTKIVEMAQVPTMQTDALKGVLQTAFTARNGPNGNQAAMQWIKEAYPGTMDNSLYAKLQATMESGRDDFQNAQTALIDRKREYQTELGSFPKGLWLHAAGYPKIDLNSIKIVSNTHTNNAYETGVDDGVQLTHPASN